MAIYRLDSSGFTLEEFCLKSRSTNKIFGAQGKYRDVIDALRTVYWFHGLRIRTNVKTLYELEKRLEPEAFYRDKSNQLCYRRNKWQHYHLGRHTPTELNVTKIGERCEGSKHEFDHVLWKVLKLNHSASRNAYDWIQQLEPGVQSLLWQKQKKSSKGRLRQRKLGRGKLNVLERQASLDALACLTLMLREAHENADSEYAYELSRWVCRMLVLIGKDLNGHGIAQPLYEFYELAILPLGAYQGLRYTLSGVCFRRLVGWLSDALYHLDGVKLSVLKRERIIRLEQKIMSGEYGFDYLYLLNPVVVPVEQSLGTDHPLMRVYLAEQNLRLWALNALHNWTNEKFPSEELLATAGNAYHEVKRYQRSLS